MTLSDSTLAKMIAKPMLHPFPSFANCIRNLAKEVLQLRHEKSELERVIARHMVRKDRVEQSITREDRDR